MQDVRCKDCGRYIFKAAGTVVAEAINCPNSKCNAVFNVKIISADHVSDIKHKFISPERPSKLKAIEVS